MQELMLEDIVHMYLHDGLSESEKVGVLQDMEAALEGRYETVDLERAHLEQLYSAVEESVWIPPEYYMNDWISDACEFLRTGKGVHDSV